MAKDSNSATTDGKDKTSFLGKVLGWIFKSIYSVLAEPYKLFSKLISDEKRRIYYNNKVLVDVQKQPISRERKSALIHVTLNMIIYTIFVILLVSGNMAKLNKVQVLKSMVVKKFPYIELKNVHNLRHTIFLPWGIGLLSCLIFSYSRRYMLFHSKSSRYRQFMKHMASYDEQWSKSTPDYEPMWYYPGAIWFAHLPPDSTHKDFVERNGLWNSVNFIPTKEVQRLQNDNKYVFVAAPQKPSESTMIYDRYEEWTKEIEDDSTIFNWNFGECINENNMLRRNCFEFFSMAFFGAAGSGKTEAMKFTFTHFMCKHPYTHMIICDPKGLGDWDSFSAYTEFGRIIKDKQECVFAIASVEYEFQRRKVHMERMKYKNIRAWSEAENIDVPPLLLVVDEFPQLEEDLKFGMDAKTDRTPANTLFKLYTLGRAFGIWVILGSQMADSGTVPHEIQTNLQVRVILKMTTPSASMQWLGSECAFTLGMTLKNPDGTPNKQMGYGFVNTDKDAVRFWYIHDWIIAHEFLKYGVKPIGDNERYIPKKMGLIPDWEKAIKLVGRKKISKYLLGLVEANERGQAFFATSFESITSGKGAIPVTGKESLWSKIIKRVFPFLTKKETKTKRAQSDGKKQPLVLPWNSEGIKKLADIPDARTRRQEQAKLMADYYTMMLAEAKKRPILAPGEQAPDPASLDRKSVV